MLSKKEQKLIKSLKIKKYRTRERRFLVEGTKNVLELLSSNFTIDFLVGTSVFFEDYQLAIGENRFEVVKSDLLSQLGFLKTNESVLAVVQMANLEEQGVEVNDALFVLDGVSDPGNLGTIIRTLDWFGFDTLVCSMDSADFYNPKVIASTMGSFTRVKVLYRDLSEFVSNNPTFHIYCTDMEGEDIASTTIQKPCMVLMGSESHGVRAELARKAEKRITIPRVGRDAESLNVGVATGIIANQLRILK